MSSRAERAKEPSQTERGERRGLPTGRKLLPRSVINGEGLTRACAQLRFRSGAVWHGGKAAINQETAASSPRSQPRRARLQLRGAQTCRPVSERGKLPTPSLKSVRFSSGEHHPARAELFSSAFWTTLLVPERRRTPGSCGQRGPRRGRDPATAPLTVRRGPRAARPALTISERPSRQAFWKRACLSSWGRSLKPVYLICGNRAQSEPRRADKRSAQTALPALPGPSAQTFRPPPHLALAAQLPEELLVLELAALVGDDPRHGAGPPLPSARPALSRPRHSPRPLLAPAGAPPLPLPPPSLLPSPPLLPPRAHSRCRRPLCSPSLPSDFLPASRTPPNSRAIHNSAPPPRMRLVAPRRAPGARAPPSEAGRGGGGNRATSSARSEPPPQGWGSREPPASLCRAGSRGSFRLPTAGASGPSAAWGRAPSALRWAQSFQSSSVSSAFCALRWAQPPQPPRTLQPPQPYSEHSPLSPMVGAVPSVSLSSLSSLSHIQFTSKAQNTAPTATHFSPLPGPCPYRTHTTCPKPFIPPSPP